MKSHPRLVGAAALLSLLPFAATACSEVEGSGTWFTPIQRPPLRLAAGVTPAPPLQPWWTGEPANDQAEIVKALRTDVVADPSRPDGPGLLRLYSRDKKILRMTLPTGAGRLDRIRTRVWIDRFDTLDVRWMRGDAVAGGTSLPIFPDSVPREVVVDVPASASGACDRLEFVVRGEGPAAIGTVEVFEVRGEHRLPQPGKPPIFVTMGDDVRPAWGLTPHAPAEIAFQVPPVAVLLASAAVPVTLRQPGVRPILVARIQGPTGAEHTHRFLLTEQAAGAAGWIPVRIPLDVAAGASAVARFSLESKSGADTVCALTQPQIVGHASGAPTVLFVTSDTHRGDHAGFARAGVPVATPVLDALAARGVVFEDAWSATNVTIPSHVALFTGLPLRDTGVLDNAHALAADAATLAEHFAERGWATVAAVSASHLDADWSGLGQGFDRIAVCTTAKRAASETLDQLERWLPDHRGAPLFVWLHLFDAHTPYEPPAPYDKSSWDAKRDPYDPSLPEPDPKLVPKHLKGLRDLDYVRAQYRGEVAYLDKQMARLLDHPRFSSAIVAFTADHGESFGTKGVYWDHGGLYPDRLRVPLVLRWPGAPAGRRVSAKVSNLDVGRTLLDLAGMAGVEHPGQSLLRHVDASPRKEPMFAVACFGFAASIADGNDFLVLNLSDHEVHNRSIEGLRARHTTELYDLAADPGCERDVASSRVERARELRARLVEWLRAAQLKSWRQVSVGSAAVLENLAALGYAGDTSIAADAALFPVACDCAPCQMFAR